MTFIKLIFSLYFVNTFFLGFSLNIVILNAKNFQILKFSFYSSGYVGGAGRFTVEEVLYYECGPQIPLKPIDESPLVVFISGLDLANTSNVSLSLDLFHQWLMGNLEYYHAGDIDPSKIVRVVIAGNSIRASPPKQQKNVSSLTLRTFDTKDMLSSLKLLDDIIANLAQSVEVDLMPGEFDPSNHMLPQQPFHHCMFPKSATNHTFNGVPNPYQCEIESRLILGSSGQNIDDIRKYSTVDDPIAAMKNTLKWSHIAPSCPDTLPCYPYFDEDPFIISQCPHVYFCAQNSEEFQTDTFESKVFFITNSIDPHFCLFLQTQTDKSRVSYRSHHFKSHKLSLY
jgi:DNA polymerase delta subunit 2